MTTRKHETRSILLSEYQQSAAKTDVLDEQSLTPVLQGLFGEVGSVVSTAKKLTREGIAYRDHHDAAREEFGDALWYFAAVCKRLKLPLDELFYEASSRGGFRYEGAASDLTGSVFSQIAVVNDNIDLDNSLFKLAKSAAALLQLPPARENLVEFAAAYIEAIAASRLNFAEIVGFNLRKIQSAFLDPDRTELPDFDKDFLVEEQLPRKFEIRINQRPGGRSYLRWNGVFIGDPLTDNIADPDGYRFHDVFHFAYAAILHWSPVMRGLIKHKRKSKPEIDEAQDGGRAIVVEEGLSAWIFSRAKDLNFFEDQKKVSFDILKTIQQFTSGYEVSDCPLKLWQRAILDGYSVFRDLRKDEGGWIIGDRNDRSIQYKPLDWKE